MHTKILSETPRTMKKLLLLLALAQAQAGASFTFSRLKRMLEEYAGKKYHDRVLEKHLETISRQGLLSRSATVPIRYTLTAEGEKASWQVRRLVEAGHPDFAITSPTLTTTGLVTVRGERPAISGLATQAVLGAPVTYLSD